jgi:type IV pilus assembly protein PilV
MNARLTTSRRASAGFTLVEVIMAMLIMTVGLLGLLQSVNVAYEHNTRNRLREEAVLVGEEQMNLLRGMSFGSTPYLNTTTATKVMAGTAKKFSVTRQCQPMGATNRLKISVSWSFKNVSTTHAIYTLKNS